MSIDEFYKEHSVMEYDENIIGVVKAAKRSSSFGDLVWFVHEVDDGAQTFSVVEANGAKLFPVGTRVQVVAYASTKGYKVRSMRELKRREDEPS